MKRTITTLLLCLFFTAAEAQTHLSFKGVQMTGTTAQYAELLKTKGFLTKGTGKEGLKMTGCFAGRQNATIILGPVSEVCDTIKTVSVLLTEDAVWSTLTASFEFYRQYYTTKYGNPTELSQKGTGEDYRSLADLKKGICHYHALWKTPDGTITMTLQYQSGACAVVIKYTDAAGAAAEEREILGDI